MLAVSAGDPGNVRWFNNGRDYGIDGQVYGLRPGFTDQSLNGGPANPKNPQNDANFVSFLVWSGFTPGNPVTWHDLQPVFQQYANLYPVMNRFLDLGNYDPVVANAGLLTWPSAWIRPIPTRCRSPAICRRQSARRSCPG